jgi:Domain of unknown function (DUF4188)/Acetyltransferase (GNAT) family
MNPVFAGRFTAQMDGPFVVFLIGMRVNRLLAVHQWLPVARAMGPKAVSASGTRPTGSRPASTNACTATCRLSSWRLRAPICRPSAPGKQRDGGSGCRGIRPYPRRAIPRPPAESLSGLCLHPFQPGRPCPTPAETPPKATCHGPSRSATLQWQAASAAATRTPPPWRRVDRSSCPIHPSYQGKGLGTWLITQAIAHAPARGIETLTATRVARLEGVEKDLVLVGRHLVAR